MEALSGKQRQRRLDAILAACQAYINGVMAERLSDVCMATVQKAGATECAGAPDQRRAGLTGWSPKTKDAAVASV